MNASHTETRTHQSSTLSTTTTSTSLGFGISLTTGHRLNLYCPPQMRMNEWACGRKWLTRGELHGGVREAQASDTAWESIQELAATASPRLWPSLMQRKLNKQAWEALTVSLGMPGAAARSRTVLDAQEVANWAAWNREALRHQLILRHPQAPDEAVLHSSADAIEVSHRFQEEAVSFLELPAEYGVRLTAEEMTSILWKLAQRCRDLDVIEMRRTSLIATAGLHSEEDYEDLRALVWRGNEDAQVVLDGLQRLDEAEDAAVLELDDVGAEIEFLVRDRRMARKTHALTEAKRLVEALLPVA